MSETESGYGAVYTLSDPRTGEVRYVGATRNAQGRREALKHDPPNENMDGWVSDLRENGLMFEMDVVECAPLDEIGQVETEYIQQHANGQLLNVQMKGGGSHTDPRENAAPASYPFQSDDPREEAGDE
jgi:hypothetical protein